MLWLSLFLPNLPLEVFSRGSTGNEPLAVAAGQGNRQYVLACNAPASNLGVRPGMTLSAAQALVGGLQVRGRNEAAEAEALEGLAAWAGQFTPVVSMEPPQALLLEVEGSLSLFGGAARLLGRVRRGMAELGYQSAMALVAPPAAALLLARAGREVWVAEPQALIEELNRVPLEALDIPADIRSALRSLGLRQLKDLLHLPRDGLARRYGPELVGYLDRVTGRAADPRRPFVVPERFKSRLVLPAEVEHTGGLLFAARRLLAELVGFLRARAAGAQRLGWTLLHEDQPTTRFLLGLVAPSRDLQHLTGLLKERLERVQLPQPVQEIALTVEEFLPLSSENHTLLPEADSASEDWYQLVERLSARLGSDAVQGIRSEAEHRPERAWSPCSPGESGPETRFGPRPLWLLAKPLPLETKGNRPLRRGMLNLLRGPERIESGWWDGRDVARDYFVAENPQGERFWIFRERGERRWFLHGVFG